MKLPHSLCLLLFSVPLSQALAGEPAFRVQDVDTQIEIGYGLAIADVQGDGKPDILLADKKQFVWYEAPSWTKHVIAENLTEKDNVCIAARDIDGDGKCEIAVGAEWNPGDTVNSGAVFYLIPPADRTQKWEAVKFPSVEPTTHRMKWVRRTGGADGKDRYDLVVVPLHGRGNKNGEGAGVKVLAYQMPKNPKDEWKSEVVADDMHMTHNFHVLRIDAHDSFECLLLAGKEGLQQHAYESGTWKHLTLFDHKTNPDLKGAGEIRFGMLPKARGYEETSIATVEPMHGNQLVVYRHKVPDMKSEWQRTVLDDKLDDGHALACGDLLGTGSDQIVVGWRGAPANKLAKVGIKIFVPDAKGGAWTQHVIDDNTMACEDLTLADLNADGKLDIIAAGRRTKNVKIYWNKSK